MTIGFSTAAELPTLISEFLNIPDDGGDWNEGSAQVYLNHLIEKHGAKIQEEMNQVTEEDKAALLQSLDNKPQENGRKWHIGDATLTKLDESVIGSTFNKLKDSLPSLMSGDSTNLQDYGVYFFSISDTDIFEGLGE